MPTRKPEGQTSRFRIERMPTYRMEPDCIRKLSKGGSSRLG